jgi:SAM-dependent methyltransferase
MDSRLEQNRRHWDSVVPIHAASRFYDVEGFLGGKCALLPIEARELGDVRDKRLVHLQCHFGLDTLSLARRGAQVTGVDFSPRALAEARSLAERARIDARFVESEVTRAHEALDGETFDLVFTSWGVLGWLPDLEPWARAVSALLTPGGSLYLVEVHPVLFLYDGSRGPTLERHFPYFRSAAPIVEDVEGTYADESARVVETRRYSWIFELGQVVNVLIDAGLRIERLNEHDGTCSRTVPSLVRHDDGLFRLPEGELSLPLSFSIRASKPR